MIKKMVCLGVVLLLCIAFAGCPAEAKPGSGDELTPIEGKDFTGLVSLPKYSSNFLIPVQRPVTVAVNNGWGFTAPLIEWYQSGDGNTYTAATGNNFYEYYYRADITLEAKRGFTFDGLPANSFTHNYAWIENPAGTGTTLTVQIWFLKAYHSTGVLVDLLVDLTDLRPYLLAPYRGGTPQQTVNSDQYSGTIAWETEAGGSHTGAFGSAAQYKAVIPLNPKTGYRLSGLTANSFTYAGAQDVSFDLKTGAVSILFAATADVGTDTVVNNYNLTSLLSVPAHRATVTAAFSIDQYNAAVQWFYADDDAEVSGTAAYDRPFRAVVTLTAKEGFTLTGVPVNAFVHTGATSVTNAANSGDVTVLFPAAHWTVGTLSYPRVGPGGSTDADPAGWGATVESCCWPTDSNPRGGAVLVTSRNPGNAPPRSDTSISSNLSTDYFWDYAWQGDSNNNRSSWQLFVGSGGSFYQGTTVYQTGWRGGSILNGDESGQGHQNVLTRDAEANNVPEALRKRAHCWSIDLQAVREIATFEIYPKRNAANSITDNGTLGKWPIQIEVFYSSKPIGPLPNVDDPDQDVHSLGIFDLPDMTSTPVWRGVNLYEAAADGKPVSTRYFHFRVYAEQNNRHTNGWVAPSFAQIRFGVSD